MRDDIEIRLKDSSLVISAARHPRSGWQEAFQAMADQRDDARLDADAPSEWDLTEWQW